MKRRKLKYDPKLKQRARELRANMTLGEVLLWNHLKQKQMLGYDFHRQRPIGNHIVDFICPELDLVIEVDGSSHNDRLEVDHLRQSELEQLGLSVLRFLERDIKCNPAGVLKAIEEWIQEKRK
jgi:very-short-patch-repair endonuclease